MANIKAALYALLTSDSTLNGIVKGVSPQKISQIGTTYPRITYRLTGKETPYDLLGGPSTIPTARFEVVIYSYSNSGYNDLQAAADALRPVLNGCRLKTVGGVWIHAVLIDDESEDYLPPYAADDVGVHQITFDIGINYNE